MPAQISLSPDGHGGQSVHKVHVTRGDVVVVVDAEVVATVVVDVGVQPDIKRQSSLASPYTVHT